MQYVYRCARHRYGLQECTVRIELLFTGFQFLSQATLASSRLGTFSPPPPPHRFIPSCRSQKAPAGPPSSAEHRCASPRHCLPCWMPTALSLPLMGKWSPSAFCCSLSFFACCYLTQAGFICWHCGLLSIFYQTSTQAQMKMLMKMLNFKTM